MKKLLIASMLVLGAAACGGGGGGDKAAIVKACVADGDADQKACECMADKAVKDLDKDVLKIVVAASKSDDSEAYMMSKMGELSPEQLQSFMGVMMGAAMECGMDTTGG